MYKISIFTAILFLILLSNCSKKEEPVVEVKQYEAIKSTFGSAIDPNNVLNYANQGKPSYINKNNAMNFVLSDAKATLGRVLFYDTKLSIDNSISCASCHKQVFAFGDNDSPSKGVSDGLTGRHSMRLINVRFATEQKFFWDERAANLEFQTTQPIQDHLEMGFSGVNGRPSFGDLITKMNDFYYYQELFQWVYGSSEISEVKIQECLSHFIRSIQSFDSKYDEGRVMVNNDNQPFPNFTQQENQGKNLFLAPPIFNPNGERTGGGLGCNGCHNAPEFDIAPNSGNNGIIGRLNGTGNDLNNTRSPSLRDLLNPNGNPNTGMMHNGELKTIQEVLNHYGNITIAAGNNNLDPRLRPNGNGQKLNLTQNEIESVVAFLKTLTGKKVYTDVRWSNPFQ
ncbi:MAG: cytochrome c peroxidase [Bacteroidota bacterium]|nr:cytochrome c peroxidase [Bacteroidota bacterium]